MKEIIKNIYLSKDINKAKKYESTFFNKEMVICCMEKECIKINDFDYTQLDIKYILSNDFIKDWEKAKQNLNNKNIKIMEVLENKYAELQDYKNVYYAICLSDMLNILDDLYSPNKLLEILTNADINAKIIIALQTLWLENTIAVSANYNESDYSWLIGVINDDIYNDISKMTGEYYDLFCEIVQDTSCSINLFKMEYFNEKKAFINRYHLQKILPKDYKDFLDSVDLNLFFKDLKASLIKEKSSIYGNPTKLEKQAMLLLYHLGTYAIEYRQEILEEINKGVIKYMLNTIDCPQFKEDIEFELNLLQEDWRKMFSKEGLELVNRLNCEEKAQLISTLIKGSTPLELKAVEDEEYNKDDYYEEIIGNQLWIFQ